MKDPYQRKSACFHMGFLVLLQTEGISLKHIYIKIQSYSEVFLSPALRPGSQRVGLGIKGTWLECTLRKTRTVCQVRHALLCYPHKGARIAKHRNKTSPTRESSRDFPTAVAEFINKFTQL